MISARSTPPGILIAPISSKPQLVTIALDLLAQRGERIVQTILLHTSLGRAETRRAVACLAGEARSRYPMMRLSPICLCDPEGAPYDDVDSVPAAREAFRVLYRTIKDAKQASSRVHLSIAGGRKILGVYGMAAAQLLFDPEDGVWHITSTPDLIARAALHPEPGEAALIRIPVLRWSQISPVLTDLALSDDPFDALTRQEQLREADAVRVARDFVRQALSAAEREVVSLMVRQGLTNQELAARTYRSPKTVEHHLSSAYAKARRAFGLTRADRHTLTSLLATYFALEQQEVKE